MAHLGRAKIASGRPAQAVAYLDEALPVIRSAGDPADLAVGLLYWGLCAIFNDQPEVARERLLEGIDHCRELGFQSLSARAQLLLSYALIDMGDLQGARAVLREALPVSIRFGDYWVIPQQLSGFAGIAAMTGRSREALRFIGFARALSQHHDFSIPTVSQDRAERWIAPARIALGATAADALAEGARMTLEQVAAMALASEDPRPPPAWKLLTAREVEVAQLVARGMTNRQVADQLYLSVRTVDVHVDHILSKLGFNTRTQLARWAYETEATQNT